MENRLTRDPTTHPIETWGFNRMKMEELFAIAIGKGKYSPDWVKSEAVSRSCASLHAYLDRTPPGTGQLYGVDTCFGPHAYESIEDRESLQASLVDHLSVVKSDVSQYLDERESRAVYAARIHVLGQGGSGVRRDLIDRMIANLDEDLIPRIPIYGSLGASGDLIPLSAIAKHLRDAGWNLAPKEAIALTNGTSFMTGLLGYQTAISEKLGGILLQAVTIQVRMLEVFPDAFHPDLGKWKISDGTTYVCRKIHPVLRSRTKREGERVQDSYVIRAIPLILGCFLDNLTRIEREIERELESVSDNPVYCESEDRFLEGALFYGSHISQLADEWNLTVVNLSNHLERLIQYLLDPSENEGRLPLLLSAQPGKFAGLAGLGLLATHTIAEMRRDAMPGSIQSLPTNAGNQNIVPMGGVSVVRNRRTLGDFQKLIEIYLLCLRQVSFFTDSERIWEEVGWGRIGEISPVLEDRGLGKDLEDIEDWVSGMVFLPS